MKSGIYSINNIFDGKIYYGSSVNIFRRLKRHKLLLQQSCHTNSHLQFAWNKYRENNFQFSIIENVDISQLLEREQFYLNQCKNQPELHYNI